MQQAEAWGYRPENGNPCKGIRRYRQGRSERFLSPEEYPRLGRVLDNLEMDHPLHVAAVRLLLLTGCRKSEILTLEWRFYRDGNLHLPDGKTGPRTVWLCRAARGHPGFPAAVVLEVRLSRETLAPAKHVRMIHHFWSKHGPEASLEDVRAFMTSAILMRAWRC